jgi:putative (di)nucleoside polyphosphate hydrolase
MPEDTRPYRPCVGLMLLNKQGDIFIGNRADIPGDHWQMPQGGIDEGESPETAALREMKEEVGSDNAIILDQTNGWFSYDLPYHVSRRIWKGRYRGQKQKWFLLQFQGDDQDIDLTTHHPEFDEWKWVTMAQLPDLIVPFKRDVYDQVITCFKHQIIQIYNGNC